MDKKIANNMLVGIFVAVGFVVFIFLVFNMGGGGGIFASNYTLYAKFPEVKGLHPGSEISLSGLRIGVVKDITVSTDGTKQLITEFSISRKMKSQIRQDSNAMIRTQGMLGDKYIEISIGSASSPELESGAFIRSVEEQDFFSKGGNLVEGISKQFKDGGNVDVLLANLTRLSDNLATISTDIRKNRGVLNELIYGKSGESLNRSLNHLEGILKKIDSGDGTLGSLVNDPTIYEDLRAMMGGAKRSSILKYFMREFIEEGSEAAKRGQASPTPPIHKK